MGENIQEKISDLINARINHLRPKLLDVTRRNPLISTKFSERSNSLIRVVDEVPELILESIVSDEMRIVPLPDLKVDPKDEHTIELLCQTGPLANAINHSLEVMTASNSPKAASKLIDRNHELPKHDDRTINFDKLNQDYLVNEKNKAAVRAFLSNKLDRLNQTDMAALVELDIILLVNAARELRSIYRVKAPEKFDQLLKLRNEYRHDPNTTLTETELYCYYQDNKDDLSKFIRSLTTH